MREGGMGAALAGLAVHYALMFIMVAIFAVAVSRIDAMRRHW